MFSKDFVPNGILISRHYSGEGGISRCCLKEVLNILSVSLSVSSQKKVEKLLHKVV